MSLSRFYLKINNTVYKNVSRQQVYKISRQENRTTSFAGTDRVDRSALKYRVISRIAIISAADYATLQSQAEAITQSCQFYDGATLKTATMIIDLPETPQPWYKYGNRTNGVYYTDVTITMEEA